MQRLTIILFITAILIAASCHKDPGPFTVSGVVLDHTTNQPVDGATVYLLAHEKDGGIWGGSPSFFIDTTMADANGKFSFAPEKNDDWGYSCMAEKDLYFLGQEYTADGYYTLTVTAYLYPKAWLNVHVKAVNDYEFSDFIGINSLQTDPFYGGTVDTTEIISVTGNSTFQMTWFLFEAGVETYSQTDYIYCPAFDTTLHEIFY